MPISRLRSFINRCLRDTCRFIESTFVYYTSDVVLEVSAMPTLLHIDSSPLYGRSVSRQLTGAFVTQWKSSHLDGTVIDRDLNATPIPPINAEWVGAVYTPEAAHTPEQKELLSLSDSLLAELERADEYVVGVPMHNFGVPSVLKLWIDQITRVGKTFSYAE